MCAFFARIAKLAELRAGALVTPWTGTYGLSGLVVLLAALPGLLVRLAGRGGSVSRWAWALPALAVYTALGALYQALSWLVANDQADIGNQPFPAPN